MKYIKSYESRINDMPVIKNKTGNKSEYKYKVGDIVVFKELDKLCIVKSINNSSENQDYCVRNPLDETEWGFVLEEELRDSTEEEKKMIESYIMSKKYNL